MLIAVDQKERILKEPVAYIFWSLLLVIYYIVLITILEN